MASEPNAPPREVIIPRYARIDVIGGVLMLGLAALIWVGAIGLATGKIINFGPGAMPRVLAALLFVAGGGVLLNGLTQKPRAAEALDLAWRPPVVLTLAIVLFALFIRGGDFGIVTTPRLGLMVMGPITVFLAGYATPEANAKELLALSFGMTAAMTVIFPDLLGVPIPVFPTAIQNAIPPSFGVDAAMRVMSVAYLALTGLLYLLFFGMPGARRD